jgi:hypothetical protein
MTKDEALKLALEALESCYVCFHEDEDIPVAITAIKQALAAPVQEPIGYLFQHDETGLTTVVDVQQVEWGFEKNNPRHQKIGPVYTTPPAAQRQWVGLTDEEKRNICKVGPVYAPDGVVTRRPLEYRKELEGVALMAVRKAEAKLKEKNT